MMRRKVVSYDKDQEMRMKRAFRMWRRSTGASSHSQDMILKEWMAGNLALVVTMPQTATSVNPDRPKFLGGE